MTPILRTCKGCGRAIVWAKHAATGKLIPLDPLAPVYTLAAGTDVADTPVCSKAELAFVSHFATCPKANEFSKKGKST